jgi:hypothetical protein
MSNSKYSHSKYIVNGQLVTVASIGEDEKSNKSSKKYEVNGQLTYVSDDLKFSNFEIVNERRVVHIMKKIQQKNITQRKCYLSVDMSSSSFFSLIQGLDNSFKVLLGAHKLNKRTEGDYIVEYYNLIQQNSNLKVLAIVMDRCPKQKASLEQYNLSDNANKIRIGDDVVQIYVEVFHLFKRMMRFIIHQKIDCIDFVEIERIFHNLNDFATLCEENYLSSHSSDFEKRMTIFNCIPFLPENTEAQKFFLAFQEFFQKSMSTTHTNEISEETMSIVLENINSRNDKKLNIFFLDIKNNIIFFNENAQNTDFIPIYVTNDRLETFINSINLKNTLCIKQALLANDDILNI